LFTTGGAIVDWASVALSAILFMVTYITLWLMYRQVYKVKKWESPAVVSFIVHTRPSVYVSLVLFALWILAFIPNAYIHGPLWHWLSILFKISMGVVAIEAATSIFFDFILTERKQIDVPTIFRDLTRIVLYIAGLLVVLNFVLNVDITPLLTGSAIISVVIGLALQESLGNLFSGIFLHGSKPFARGDWIRIGDREGAVEKVDWRSTAIRTNYGDYVILPNSVMAKEVIVNYSAPTRLTARRVLVGVHYKHNPAKIKKILIECALQTQKIHAEPRPVARIIEYGNFSVNFELKFWITDYEDHPNICANVMERVWYNFKRQDVEIPYPHQVEIHHYENEVAEPEAAHIALLKRIDWMSEFSDEELRYLASRLKLLTYAGGEPIIRQGERGKSFYVIKYGKVQIQARDEDGKLFFTKDMGGGEFFGEFSLLTGEPRTATVVALEECELLRLDKEAFRKVFQDNPKADELITQVIARRQELAQEKDAAANRGQTQRLQAEKESSRTLMLKKIRDFFSY